MSMTEVSVAEVDRRQRTAQELFTTLERQGKITILRTHNFFCGSLMCSSWLNGAPALFDNNHVTVTTSRKMRGIFRPALEAGQK